MKLEDLLRMAFNDGKRYGQGNTSRNFKQQFESTEYIEAIKLVKNCSIPVVSNTKGKLQAAEDLIEFARNNCREWNNDEMEEIIDRL